MKPEIKIESASFHRNGICGEGFWAILFTEKDEGRMVASLFDERGYCAVYNVELLTKGTVLFGCNSWRGDVYEEVLRPALEQWQNDNESNRMGPFSAIPPQAVERIAKKLNPQPKAK